MHQSLESSSSLSYPMTETTHPTLSRSASVSTRKEAWTIEDFKSIVSIGNGKFGKVFKAVEKTSNRQVALKVVYKNLLEKFDFFGQMKKELEI